MSMFYRANPLIAVGFRHVVLARYVGAFVAGRGRPGRRGVAALEFALLLPVLFSMLAGLYDSATGFIAWQRVVTCSQVINQIATVVAANNATANTLSQAQAIAATSAAYAYLPNIATGALSQFGITLSSVNMVATGISNCTVANCYTAHVAWSGIFQGTAGSLRPCDQVQGSSVISQSTDAASPTPTTLPVDDYSAAPLLVVDVTYVFQPVFYKFIVSNLTMVQSSYFPARTGLSNAYIQYVLGTTDSTTVCSGYL